MNTYMMKLIFSRKVFEKKEEQIDMGIDEYNAHSLKFEKTYSI